MGVKVELQQFVKLAVCDEGRLQDLPRQGTILRWTEHKWSFPVTYAADGSLSSPTNSSISSKDFHGAFSD
jgi:hypothetical protein